MKKDNYMIMLSTLGNGIGVSAQFYFAVIKGGILINPILSGLMMGVYFLTGSIMAILFGKLSDRMKNRKLFGIAGNLLTGFISIFYFFVSDMFFFLFSSFLMGIAFAAVASTMPALFSEHEPDMESGKLMSYFNISQSGGWAIGVLGGEILYIFVSEWVFFIFGGIAFVSAMLLLMVREKHEKEAFKPEITREKQSNDHYNFIRPFLIYLAAIIVFRHLSCQGSIAALVPNYLVLELSADELTRGFIYALNNIIQVAFMLPAGYLVDKIGRKNVLTLGLIFAFITTAGYAFTFNAWHLAPFQVTLGVSWALIINGGAAYVMDVTVEADRAKGMGFLNAGLSIGGTIGPFLASLFLFMFSQDFRISFLLLSLFSTIGIALCLILREDKDTHVYNLLGRKSNEKKG